MKPPETIHGTCAYLWTWIDPGNSTSNEQLKRGVIESHDMINVTTKYNTMFLWRVRCSDLPTRNNDDKPLCKCIIGKQAQRSMPTCIGQCWKHCRQNHRYFETIVDIIRCSARWMQSRNGWTYNGWTWKSVQGNKLIIGHCNGQMRYVRAITIGSYKMTRTLWESADDAIQTGCTTTTVDVIATHERGFTVRTFQHGIQGVLLAKTLFHVL